MARKPKATAQHSPETAQLSGLEAATAPSTSAQPQQKAHSMSDDFQNLLAKPMTDIIEPKLVPVGSYIFTATKFEFGEAQNEKKTKLVKFTMNPTAPMEDVDQTELAEAAATWGDRPLNQRIFTTDFFITPDAVHHLKRFLEDVLGVEEGLTLQEGIQAAQGRQCVGMVVHEIAKKSQRPYATVNSWAKLQE